MTLPMLTCPLCCRPGFNSAFSLWSALAESSMRQLCCPICNNIIAGLNEFAAHLFEHRISSENTASTISSQTHVEPPTPTANPKILLNPSKNVSDLIPSEPSFQSCRELLANGDFTVPSETVVTPNYDLDRKPTSICKHCGTSFPNAAILAVHVQVLHKNEKACTDSGKAFPEIKGIGKSRRRVLACEHCPRTFSLKSSLKVHLRVSHPMQEDNPGSPKMNDDRFECPTCGKSFNKETSLAQHVKTHEDKPWQCTVCSKNFSTKYFLRKHKRIHTGETPYECPTCHKVFTFQQSYHKHMLYHTDDKPYCCSSCGRLFKELSTLNNHERIHTGEKPFVCETCGKAFRQRVSYLVHRRIHTGDMPYKCTACNKSFRYKISQKTHKCSEHPPGVVIRTTAPSEKVKLDDATSSSCSSKTPSQPVPKDATPSFDINLFLREWTSLDQNVDSSNGSGSETPTERMGRLSLSSPPSTSLYDDSALERQRSESIVFVSQLSFEDAIREDAIHSLFTVAD